MAPSADSPMARVIEFLGERSQAVDPEDWDQDLIDLRILDSMALVEFLFLLEEVTGEPVDPERIDVENLRTLNRIDTAFLSRRALS
ncbi:phosphopantetheine-binding protein [Kitasatospora sp. NPDC048296]|uniref:phosphopantetheine-binding protein n=1 Tax=Kitasatospora sp. NPDC048296 TaxID=3364048 RepID=UPI00371C74FC